LTPDEFILSIVDIKSYEKCYRGKQEGLFEGELKGLKGGIEIGIALKFPEDIDMMMALVHTVEDLDTLNEIKEALKTTKDKAEILVLLK